MASKGCLQAARYFLVVLNVIFFVLGLVILGYGLWVLFDQESFMTIIVSNGVTGKNLQNAAFALIVVGGITVVLSTLGCVGTGKRIKCVLWLYLVFIMLLLVAQVVLGLLVYLEKDKIYPTLNSTILSTFMAYGNENSSVSKNQWSMWDTIQTNFNCCGYNDYKDWNINGNVKPDKRYPCTCMKAEVQPKEYFCNLAISEIKSDGCKGSVEAWLSANLLVILSVCLAVGVLEIFAVAFAIYLCMNIHHIRK